MYFSSIHERRNFICEFYLHNYLFPDNIVWNPNNFILDINLRDFQLVLENELKRPCENKSYKGEEMIVPLWIRP
jgi:hypothetical protein